MSRFLLFFMVFFIVHCNANALDLGTALRQTYMSCVGIDDMLGDMKTMAGINTAVTGVGTVAGAGAVIAGIKKQNALFENLREIETSSENNFSGGDGFSVKRQVSFKPELKPQKRKILGNWRTGLLAVNTVTNVAGAIISTKNVNNVDLYDKIKDCINSVDVLQDAMMQARAENIDIAEANDIYDACSEYKYVDLSVVKKRAKGAQIFSIVGGGVGAAGVVTSQIANSSGGDKEKNLDTVSNVLAGGATVASGLATVFNAMQISAIKRIADVAQKCEVVLK